MKTPVHLNALRAFEAAARLQSFSAAAAELHVTPAAVGQLIRKLEEWLGTPLFLRQPSGRARLQPTATAARALPEIRSGLERLANGLHQLRDHGDTSVLTVATSPAFAAKWLLPRIERFHARCPDTDLRLDTNLKPVDFASQGIDAGVRYGRGEWPGLIAEKLMDEEIFPVCAPQWLTTHGKLKSPAELKGKPLIHDVSVDNRLGFASWRDWLQQAGVSGVDTRRGMQVNHSGAVLQAAIDGHGIALARSVMVADDLAAGRLRRLFPKLRYQSQLAYYLVMRPELASTPKIIAFRQWLLQEAASAGS